MERESNPGPSSAPSASQPEPPSAKRLVLGIGGGIAAYKSAELARQLMAHGFAVEVVMTRSAEEFIRPLTFAALTGRKVITSLFSSGSADETLSSAIEHIRVAQDNQILVIAPATADLIAKLAHGLADDFLTTTYLAFTGPVILAPAMNTNMWNHPATQTNLQVLRARGHVIVDPGDGELACGMVGPGRLAEPAIIAAAIVKASLRMGEVPKIQGVEKMDWIGETLLLTAGPTQEPLDAVRYISNRSSGKMGYALAEAARDRGARVILVSGPVSIPAPSDVELVMVRTAAEMHQAVMSRLDEATAVIKAAAVADYTRFDAPAQKVKKETGRMTIELDPTTDILAEVGRRKKHQLVVGFAAETDNLVDYARAKLQAKNCDMIVANLVSPRADAETGFESDENEVVLVLPDEVIIPVARASKHKIAHRILDEIVHLRKLKQRHSARESA